MGIPGTSKSTCIGSRRNYNSRARVSFCFMRLMVISEIQAVYFTGYFSTDIKDKTGYRRALLAILLSESAKPGESCDSRSAMIL